MRRSLALAALLVACREPAGAPDAAVDGDGFPYPPPRADVVPAVGAPDTLEVATWNIENFPATAQTPARVADLITSLDLDVIVVEEIASEAAWRELLERLREHDGVLSEHRYTPTAYQKVGVIYRASEVSVGATRLLFTDDTYAFPRPAFAVALQIGPVALDVIGVHLKAGVAIEDGERRRAAFEKLDAYLRAQIDGGGEDEVILAGDYNEAITTTQGQANMQALLGAPDRYTVHTRAPAEAGAISFVPSRRLIDHVTTTAGLADELAGGHVVIPSLHVLPGYVGEVSDHLPVVLVTSGW